MAPSCLFRSFFHFLWSLLPSPSSEILTLPPSAEGSGGSSGQPVNPGQSAPLEVFNFIISAVYLAMEGDILAGPGDWDTDMFRGPLFICHTFPSLFPEDRIVWLSPPASTALCVVFLPWPSAWFYCGSAQMSVSPAKRPGSQ